MAEVTIYLDKLPVEVGPSPQPPRRGHRLGDPHCWCEPDEQPVTATVPEMSGKHRVYLIHRKREEPDERD